MDMKKMKVSKIIIIVIVVLLMVFSIYPLIYLVLQSLAPWGEVDQKLIPSQLTLRSYVQLFTSSGSQNSFTWIRALLNSFFVCIVTTAVSIATGLLVGFSLTKLSGFKGKKIVMNTLLFQMFFPVVMLLVPRYVIMKNFTNTYTGMLLPMIVSTWAVFMYINYFRTLPDAVFEAAKIDGAGAFKTLWYIALPSTKSITTIVALIGHLSDKIYDEKGNEILSYKNISFVFNPETYGVEDLKIIATRADYPDGPAKMPTLVDCAFTSGIEMEKDGKVNLYSGIGDCEEGRILIENPFANFGNIVSLLEF